MRCALVAPEGERHRVRDIVHLHRQARGPEEGDLVLRPEIGGVGLGRDHRYVVGDPPAVAPGLPIIARARRRVLRSARLQKMHRALDQPEALRRRVVNGIQGEAQTRGNGLDRYEILGLPERYVGARHKDRQDARVSDAVLVEPARELISSCRARLLIGSLDCVRGALFPPEGDGRRVVDSVHDDGEPRHRRGVAERQSVLLRPEGEGGLRTVHQYGVGLRVVRAARVAAPMVEDQPRIRRRVVEGRIQARVCGRPTVEPFAVRR